MALYNKLNLRSAAFDIIEAVTSKLDYHQSAMEGKQNIIPPQLAYV